VPRFIAPEAHPLYWAILLAVKNPTVIAVFLVWTVGIARQMMLPDPVAAGASRPAASGVAPPGAGPGRPRPPGR
jgi:hypothetical protein